MSIQLSIATRRSVSFFNTLDIVYAVYLLFKATEYYALQAGELAESVAKIIDPQYADGIDMSEVQVAKVLK